MAFRVVVYPIAYGPGRGTLAGYYLSDEVATSGPVTEMPGDTLNIQVIGYDVARIRRAHLQLLYHSTAIEPAEPLAAENDTGDTDGLAVIGYADAAIRPAHVLHYYRSADLSAEEVTPEVPQAETTPAWIGRYRPGQHKVVSNLLFSGETSESAPIAEPESETNPAWMGRYRPGQHRVAPHLLFSGETSESAPVAEPESETNPAWMGRYRPGQHRIVPVLLFSGDTSESAPPAAEVGAPDQPSIFVVAYSYPKFPAAARNLLWHLPEDPNAESHAPPQAAEESVHQTQWRRQVVKSEWITPTYGLGRLGNLEITAEAPAAQPDIGQVQRFRYRATRHVVARHLLFQPDMSSSAESIADNPSSFVPIVYTDNWYTRRAASTPDLSGESAPFVTPEAETNPNTIGRYRAGRYSIWPGLRFEPDTSQSGPQPEPETNPPFIGKHRAGQHTLWPGLRFSQDTSQSAPVPEPETNPHFLARYHKGTHRVIPGLLYGWPDTSQSGPTTPETNPHFVGRYHPAHHLVAAGLLYWQPNPSESAPTVPPPVPGGRRHLPLWMRRLELELIR